MFVEIAFPKKEWAVVLEKPCSLLLEWHPLVLREPALEQVAAVESQRHLHYLNYS